jgi:hypothetical protein
VKQVKSGRKDSSSTPGPGRQRDDGIPDAITDRLAQNAHLSAKNMARALGVLRSTREDRLVNDLGMKCYHMRLTLYTLTSAEKDKHTEIMKSMLAELARQEASNFHFPLTGVQS